MLLSAAGIFSCGRWYHGCICDSERTALLVQEGDSGSMSEKWHCFLSFSRVLFTWCVCFPGWNRAGCHQWLISVRRFHLQTTSQTLQGSALLHPPTGAIYRGSIAPRWWIEHMHTHTQPVTLFLFVSDIFPNRARPGSGPYDCPPWTDWPEQVYNGQVVHLFCKYCIQRAVKSDICIYFVL